MTGSLPRRRFLRLGVASGALFAAGGAGLAWWSVGYRAMLTKDDRPIAMTAKEFAIVKALVRALLPAEDGLPSGESLGLSQRVDEELWAADPGAREEIAWGLQLLEHVPRAYGLRGRLTELSPEGARDYLQRVLVGPHDALRQVAIALRQLLHLLYYASPSTWPAIGYGGPFVAEPAPPETHARYRGLWRVS